MRFGDDGTRSCPVFDRNGGPLDLPATVIAKNSAGDTVEITASWAAAAAPVDDPSMPGATFRDIVVPMATVPVGLWGFTLTVDGAEDRFLFNEVIE